MFNEILELAELVAQSLIRIWPYLLVTIPLAVAVQVSGAAKYIRRAFAARPVPAIILATAVGAFSPFCSCGVIPVVASLLIGGVPLAPVMSFWIASPSMDPEIFFLSVATLGWELALWRLLATLLLSLSAGFLTHLAVVRGWLAGPIMRVRGPGTDRRLSTLAKGVVKRSREFLVRTFAIPRRVELCCARASTSGISTVVGLPEKAVTPPGGAVSSSCGDAPSCSHGESSSDERPMSFIQKLTRESRVASLMVARFMLLAIVLEALFTRYVPQQWVTDVLGADNFFSVLIAAVVGVPLYTSNLTALPLVGALLAQGMDPSAALAFLIAGPTTTIPAMAAVWGLVRRRVFVLYVGFALAGAVVFGALHCFVNALS